MFVSDQKRKKIYMTGLPSLRVARSRRLVVSHHFSIFSYSFQDFYKRFFAKCSEEVCLEVILSRFLNLCLQKIWHTDKVGVPKKIGFFFKTLTWSVCQIFCRHKFNNLLNITSRQTSYEHFAKKRL